MKAELQVIQWTHFIQQKGIYQWDGEKAGKHLPGKEVIKNLFFFFLKQFGGFYTTWEPMRTILVGSDVHLDPSSQEAKAGGS